MEDTRRIAPDLAPDGPAFGPARWRGWAIAGITILAVATLYLVQVIVGVVVGIFAFLPYERLHPGQIPDLPTITKLVFTAPALFAMVIPSEALMAFLAIVLVASVVRATRANLGLGRSLKVSDFVVGLVAGLGLVFVSDIVAYVQERLVGKHPQASVQIIMSHHGLGSFALDFVTVALAAGVCEEILFRGVVFAALVQRMEFWQAAVLSGLIFATAHLDKWSFFALWAVGTGLAFLYYKTRSLWPNIVAHTAFNAFTLVVVYFFPQLAK
ncbi:MAG TPA: type II CAAX endopeptidase family protein [Candidatus Eremiobacteraceae bacterium]|nr:type II CAAX endopeptidase family protein [Candidatus Eremiobacteraceae bacterium]